MPAGALAAGAAAAPKLRPAAVLAAGAAVLPGPKENPPKAPPLAGASAELAAGAAADPKEKPPNAGCDAAPGIIQPGFSTCFCGLICFCYFTPVSSRLSHTMEDIPDNSLDACIGVVQP